MDTKVVGDWHPRHGSDRRRYRIDDVRRQSPSSKGVETVEEQTVRDHEPDSVDRRGFLKRMAWAGTGLVWTAAGGLLWSRTFGQGVGPAATSGFSFVQISDSHIGFGKDPYKNTVAATL
jgi:hypothetical protein